MNLNSIFQPIAEIIVNNPDHFIILWGGFMIAWLCHSIKNNTSHKSTFTILGMLGTFIGLVAGLWMFDSTDMDSSIIRLLDGLKISFLTSIIGILCSLIYSKFGSKYKKNTNFSVEDALSSIANNTERTSYNIEKLTKSIGGDSENSIVGQIKLLKGDINDNHKSLTKSIDEFAEKISAASTDAIVEALQDVVKNFNEKITDQFGEHFKHLNEGVEKLVIWQSEYKDYLEGFKSNLELANTAVKSNTENTIKLSNQMKDIEEHTKNIPANLKTLEGIIEKQSKELVDLIGTLDAFSKIKDEASKTIPEIEKHLNNLVKDLSDNINNTTKDFTNITSEAIKASELQKQEITRNIDKMQQSIQSELSNTSKNLEDAMKQVFTISDEHIKTQVKEIIEQMGSELTSISRHLAKDYKELSLALSESIENVKNKSLN